MTAVLKNFDDLERALKRFYELYGCREGTAEETEFKQITAAIYAFEVAIALKIQRESASYQSDPLPAR